MPFDQSAISEPLATRDDASLIVSWSSTAAAGTLYQVYLDAKLAWSGTATRAVLPYPGESAAVAIDVGTVAAGEGATSFAASLPAHPGGGSRVRLSWVGGVYLSDDLEAFRVYQGVTAGGAVDYDAVVATVPASTAGVVGGGYGTGGYGTGGYGASAMNYSWTSGVLSSGVWEFGVIPVDTAGNEGTPEEITATIAGPPRPPAANAAGARLTAAYDDGTAEVTLTWAASPG